MWFDSNQVLGVAWGTTTSAIAARLQPKPTQDSLIVQFNGAGNVRTSGVSYAGAIIQKFSRAFSANMLDFPVPAFFDSPLTKEMMWRERSVRRVLEAQERADIAVFSVGGFGGGLPSHVYAGGYLEPGELDALQEDGVVGDVCTVFLRGDGSSEGIEINRRATGPSHDKLRQIPRRILVASGKHKVAPLLGALRAGLATDLVVDDRTFKRLNAKALREARGA
jgi:DNA-binding transcriptional regulator LsrR (DeoR family)